MSILRRCIFAGPLWLLSWLSPTGARGGPEQIGGEIEVEPPVVRLVGEEGRQQVAVTGRFADGGCRDLTAEARFAVEPAGVAIVSPSGVVTPVADGPAVLRVAAGGRIVEVPSTWPDRRRGGARSATGSTCPPCSRRVSVIRTPS